MKGKRMIAGILLVGIMSVTLTGCKNTDNMKEEPEKPVIILGSDNYPPYNYLRSFWQNGISGGGCPDQLGGEKRTGGERRD